MNKHKSKPANLRRSVDISDKIQVKVLRKRLKLSQAQLSNAIERSGGSISTLIKDATALKTN